MMIIIGCNTVIIFAIDEGSPRYFANVIWNTNCFKLNHFEYGGYLTAIVKCGRQSTSSGHRAGPNGILIT